MRQKQSEKVFPDVQEIDQAIRGFRRHRSRVRFFKALLLILVIALGVGIYLNASYFNLLRVEGNSMRKTLENGDTVLCWKTSELQYGDVIAFELEDVLMIKRVIGLEGDRIVLQADGTVLRNGQKLDEPYVYDLDLGSSDVVYPVLVGKGEVFCLGDHRSTSVDSRNSHFGNIPAADVLGTVKAVIWPAYRIGLVD